MGLFSIFSRKASDNEPKIQNILDLTDEQREVIEDMTSEGMRASDVANAVGVPAKIIYAYRKSMAARQQNSDPVVQATHELEAIKMQQEILRVRADIAAMKAELDGPTEDDQSPDAMMMMLLSRFLPGLAGGQNPLAGPLLSSAPVMSRNAGAVAPNGTVSGSGPGPAPTLDLTDDELVKLAQLIPNKQRNLLAAMPDQTVKNQFKEYLPRLSENTLVRAVEIIKR